MTVETPSSNLPRESWSRLIGTLFLLLAVIGAVV